ncbi:hypothetical protein BGZ51_006297 [Haplosporangium sp. Z 767]|nr:hypothetical protein BGZ50_007602 [Haplosporangium sp. Z 11]KAF9180315.1 hypothetical protein BGZ51_006297 [Haplosporangium sp. Z 767]
MSTLLFTVSVSAQSIDFSSALCGMCVADALDSINVCRQYSGNTLTRKDPETMDDSERECFCRIANDLGWFSICSGTCPASTINSWQSWYELHKEITCMNVSSKGAKSNAYTLVPKAKTALAIAAMAAQAFI